MTNLTTKARELISEDPALAAEVHRLMGDRSAVGLIIGLTPKQQNLLAYIHSYMRNHEGVAPSFADMAEYLGCARSGVFAVLTGLEERGAIRRLPNRPRAIAIVEQSA